MGWKNEISMGIQKYRKRENLEKDYIEYLRWKDGKYHIEYIEEYIEVRLFYVIIAKSLAENGSQILIR